jgi:tetratricopeptide (TPR) repeat protein
MKGSVETELVRRALQREENCLWRDRRDISQNKYLTEARITPSTTVPTPCLGAPADTKAERWCADAMEYLRQGDYERAAEAYRQVLTVDGSNLSAMNNLAIIYEKRPEWYPQAVETWQRVIKLSDQLADERHGARARKHLETLTKLIPPGC